MAKARKQKLKVFRTAAGFDDAFVAAPSRKAALEAWGAGTDLFSAGIAEEVKNPSPGSAEAKAAKAALAKPGEVVRVRRGGGKEVRPSTGSGRTEKGSSGKSQSKAKPKPSRSPVEKAEAALAGLENEQSAERAALAKEEERLAKRRRALEDKQAKARDKAQTKLEAAEERYRKALREWER